MPCLQMPTVFHSVEAGSCVEARSEQRCSVLLHKYCRCIPGLPVVHLDDVVETHTTIVCIHTVHVNLSDAELSCSSD